MKKKIHLFSLMIIATLLMLFTGCLLLENFDVDVTIDKDGSYKFVYDGTLALAQTVLPPKLDSKEAKEFFKEIEKALLEADGFKKVKHLGKGRFKVFVEKLGKPGEEYNFISKSATLFSIYSKKDHTITITGMNLGKNELEELKSLGAKINGTVKVSLAKGVSVIKHNAQTEPKFFNFFGGYKWTIKSFDICPNITVKLSS